MKIKKKGFHLKWNTFFSELDAIHSQIIGGDADVDHTQTIGGDTAKLLGDISPTPSGFRHPCFKP